MSGDESVLSGWLKKKGDKGLIKGWKNRWFQVRHPSVPLCAFSFALDDNSDHSFACSHLQEKEDGKIYYYKVRDDAEHMGFIEIAKVRLVLSSSDLTLLYLRMNFAQIHSICRVPRIG